MEACDGTRCQYVIPFVSFLFLVVCAGSERIGVVRVMVERVGWVIQSYVALCSPESFVELDIPVIVRIRHSIQ